MAEQPADADVAQLVERNLAKVEVAGSNLVIRSKLATKPLLFTEWRLSSFYLRPIKAPSPTTARYLLLFAGGLLWSINLLYNRPLFIDEANVVRNLFDRPYPDLFRPLDHAQYGPPVYLVVTKWCAEVFGYAELPLRLPAFLGGLLGLGCITHLSRRLIRGYWSLLPVALLFTNPTLLRYVTEVKPYSWDFGIAALLFALYYRARPLNFVTWLVVGAIVPWCSLPSVFVLAAVGLAGVVTDRRWIFPITGWLASFAVLYLLVLAPSVGTDYLDAYHAAYFLSPNLSVEFMHRLIALGGSILRLSVGFTAVAQLWGAGLLVFGIWAVPRRFVVFLLPLLLTGAASALHYYSLMDRLMLFSLPGSWLWLTLSGERLQERLPKLSWAILAVTVLAIGGTQTYRHYLRPITFSDGRKLASFVTVGRVIVDESAVPVVDYYSRIHPVTRHTTQPIQEGSITDFRGEVHVLFDVTTQKRIRDRIAEVQRQGRERGCSEVEPMYLFRAQVVALRCPARNSDP